MHTHIYIFTYEVHKCVYVQIEWPIQGMAKGMNSSSVIQSLPCPHAHTSIGVENQFLCNFCDCVSPRTYVHTYICNCCLNCFKKHYYMHMKRITILASVQYFGLVSQKWLVSTSGALSIQPSR